MSSHIRLVVLAFTLSLITTNALAEISPMLQTRRVIANAVATDTPEFSALGDTAFGSGFDPMDVTFDFSVSQGVATASVLCTQFSLIEPDRIVMSGGAAGAGDASDFDASGQAGGESVFILSFRVTAPTPFTLTGSISSTSSPTYLGANTKLDFTSGVVNQRFEAFNEVIPINIEGTLLEHITYGFVVDSEAGANGRFTDPHASSAAYDLVLQLGTASAVAITSDQSTLAVQPNPFSGRTQIFAAPAHGESATVAVYDVHGRRLRTFAAGGGDMLSWDGRDDRGNLVAAGTYLVRMTSAREVIQRKITFMR